ncbi:flavodoxin domain-containing protein [Pseudonocardia acidicola]|uniref:Flavodoxin n=1 Tax=Pseudonocardia acidicola TaxID=2724939 RepID=A0ABX1SGY7_9PSEU|nr:flavodoxin domain-containing protein [Pseudonocardia acidicola]NMI00336.1 flavodoxin [Pseudonocardia acidicola]
MSDVLVAYATRSGATAEIAEAIATELRACGLDTDVRAAGSVHDLDGYRAVVLGSALYLRRWRPDAVRFLRRHVAALSDRRVWLFHSGPCGRDRDAPQPEPAVVRRRRRSLDCDPPVTFGGKLDPATARGFFARRMATGELAGDFRDWTRIRAWARGIAAELGARVDR